MKDISINIKTIKRHAKRLHKILKAEGLVTEDFKLTQAQEIFAKSLGCNNWFELQETFKHQAPMVELKLTPQEKVVYAITDHLNANRGNVGKKFWYMLMNAHQIMGANEKLDKIVSAFTNKFKEDVHPNEVNFNDWNEFEEEFNRDPEFVELIQGFVPPKVVQGEYKPSVIVIDSSQTILKATRLFLDNDYEVVLFENSARALEYLESHKPELIICDLDVPSLTDTEPGSGYRFIETLNTDIPVIFLDKGEKTINIKENQEYLAKPFSKTSLQEKVEATLLK